MTHKRNKSTDREVVVYVLIFGVLLVYLCWTVDRANKLIASQSVTEVSR